MVAANQAKIRSKLTTILWIVCISFTLGTTTVPAQDQKNVFLTKVVDKIQQLQKEVADLRNQNERMKNGIIVFRKEVLTSLKKIKLQIQERSATTATTSENWQAEATELNRELRLLNEAIRVLSQRLDTLEQSEKVRDSATNDIDDAEQLSEPPTMTDESILPDSNASQSSQNKRPPPPVTKVVTDENEYSAYSLAMSALDDADYTRLRDELSIFLQDYPQGNFAADATYWIADSYYAEGEWSKAERYFLQLTQNYDNSDKHEMALLKIAFIKQRDRQWEAARKILEPLAVDAKDEKIRSLANERLEQIKDTGY